MVLPFTKMEGLGNDFVMVEDFRPDADQVRAWCDRRLGIGADGVLSLSRSSRAGVVVRMDYWNSNGSGAEMCGNGLRCVARYVFDRDWTRDRSFGVETPVGLRQVEVRADGLVRAELGPYSLGSSVEACGFSFTSAEVGNPHAGAFVADQAALDKADLEAIGPAMQDHPAFPEGVNVELVAPCSAGAWQVRVWERGVGETRACGTGAAAVAAVVAARSGERDPVGIRLPGGELGVEMIDGAAWIQGPAVQVFEGTIRI